ncbi:MAG: hypothetical protein ACREDF_07080, partial [Thermoplasmata archaeon]
VALPVSAPAAWAARRRSDELSNQVSNVVTDARSRRMNFVATRASGTALRSSREPFVARF